MMQGTSRKGTPFPFFIIQRERPPCEITYQLAVGTQNCFSTLFYTPYTNIKTSVKNAPKCTIARQKNKKNFWLGGTALIPTGEGGYPSPDSTPFGASILAPSVLPFLSFTTRTLLNPTHSLTPLFKTC